MPVQPDYNEEQMLKGFRNGNEPSFSAIFKALYPALCFYGFQITGDQAAAEDMAEEAFLKIWERRQMFHQYRLLKSYLYTIVRNGSINWLKARDRQHIALNDPAADARQPEKLAWENLIQAELIRQLHTGISKLPAQRQRVFKMLYQEGKSVKEVAEELNLSISAIKDHKRAGLIFLRKILPLLAVLTLYKSWV